MNTYMIWIYIPNKSKANTIISQYLTFFSFSLYIYIHTYTHTHNHVKLQLFDGKILSRPILHTTDLHFDIF